MRKGRNSRWEEVKDRTRNAFFLAALAMVASLPMFHYRFLHLGDQIFARQPSAQQAYYLALSQSFMVLVAAFLSALVWFLYRDRLGLPRFGRMADIPAGLLSGLAVGLVLTPLIFLACDREILRHVPALFPSEALWALAHMAGAAVVQEAIFRLGLMTIGLYFLHRWRWRGYPWPVILPVAVFGAVGNYLLLVKFNLVQILPPAQVTVSVFLSLGFQWLYCHLYLKWGFAATVAFHLGMEGKLLIYALVR
jgi:hypothetical protein